jgi:hypothetical protein
MLVARVHVGAVYLVIGLLGSAAIAADLPGSGGPVIDTHVPEPDEPVEYDAPLAPSSGVPGTIATADRYAWYCFKANDAVPISVTVVTTSGGLRPNCGLLRSVVEDGVQVTELGQILAATNSLNPTSVTLQFTPTFTDAVTLWVAGALESTGDYTVTMTGGEERSSCSPCPACIETTSPPDDEAQFRIGTPTFAAPDTIKVPLVVDAHEDITFTQMRIEYDSACLTFVPGSATAGLDVTSPGAVFEDDAPGAVDPDSDRHVQLNLPGTYTGCNNTVFVLSFRFTPGFVLPCRITWDPTLDGPNSNNHLNYATGGDRKILPGDINFCVGEIECDPNVDVAGTVEYFSNGTPVIAGVPDPGSVATTVRGCSGSPTTPVGSPNGDYTLSFGAGPVNVDLCASRPLVVCGSDEDGVISGDDVEFLAIAVIPPGVTDPKLQLAADVNRDGMVDATDVLAIQRWIARRVCLGSDACEPTIMQTKNCAGTWRYIFFTDPGDPGAFEADEAHLPNVCNDATVPIQGILVGDFDGSWPEFFAPKPRSQVALEVDVKGWVDDEVALALRVDLDPGESLRHVIYSLDYDAAAFEYLGMQPGSRAVGWGGHDNPDQIGVAHGIAIRPPRSEPITESGEVIVFRFRARRANATSTISFSRLKANDLDVVVPEIQITRGNPVGAVPEPKQYSLTSTPNPFNPSTQATFAIPSEAGIVPVVLRVYDVTGRIVRTLVDGTRGPGYHHVVWDGNDAAGKASSAGVYLLRIEAGAWSSVEKLTLVK